MTARLRAGLCATKCTPGQARPPHSHAYIPCRYSVRCTLMSSSGRQVRPAGGECSIPVAGRVCGYVVIPTQQPCYRGWVQFCVSEYRSTLLAPFTEITHWQLKASLPRSFYCGKASFRRGGFQVLRCHIPELNSSFLASAGAGGVAPIPKLSLYLLWKPPVMVMCHSSLGFLQVRCVLQAWYPLSSLLSRCVECPSHSFPQVQ